MNDQVILNMRSWTSLNSNAVMTRIYPEFLLCSRPQWSVSDPNIRSCRFHLTPSHIFNHQSKCIISGSCYPDKCRPSCVRWTPTHSSSINVFLRSLRIPGIITWHFKCRTTKTKFLVSWNVCMLCQTSRINDQYITYNTYILPASTTRRQKLCP